MEQSAKKIQRIIQNIIQDMSITNIIITINIIININYTSGILHIILYNHADLILLLLRVVFLRITVFSLQLNHNLFVVLI